MCLPRRLVTLSLTALLTVPIAACESPFAHTPAGDGPVTQSAVVVANHAHAKPLSPADPTLRALAERLVAQRGRVTVVVVDGAPGAVRTMAFPDRADNDLQRRQQDDRYVTALVTALTTARPALAEADELSAIDLACRVAAGGAPGSSIDVLAPGLSTVTARMQDGLLADGADVAESVDRLAQARSVPDLARCPTIRWTGLGETAPPQPPLTIPARRQLQAFYEKVIGTGGGSVRFDTTPLVPGPAASELPPVSVVPVGGPRPALSQSFTDAQVGFRVGTAELRDPPAADDALAGAARTIVSRSIPRVWVIGTTSSEGDDNLALSRRRAAVVCDRLRAAGVAADVLQCVGVATDFAGFVPDHNTDGSLDEDRARRNRLVLLTTDPARV